MKLIKFLLKFVFAILIIALVAIGTIFVLISDSTDNAPIDLFDSSITLDSELSNKINSSFNTMDESYSLDFDFSEDEINKIVYGVIKEKLNNNYNPKNATTDEEKYILEAVKLPSSIPVVGNKKVVIKNAYIEMSEKGLNFFVTANALGIIKTRVGFGFELKTEEDRYEFVITKLSLGKINLMSSFGKKVFNTVLSSVDFDEKKINDLLEENNLPFTFKLDTMSLVMSKNSIGDLLKGIIVQEENDNTMFTELLGLLTNSENEMIKIGTFTSGENKSFGLKIDLNKLKVEESEITLNPEIALAFDQNLYITNKTQTFIMNNLVSSLNKKITFTELEFNKLIYNNSNGYEGFGVSIDVYDGAKFSFKIDGIILSIKENGVTIDLILDLNGMKTKASIKTIAHQIVDSEIELEMPSQINIGSLSISSSFIKDIFKTSLNDFKVLEYDEVQNKLLIKAETFKSLMDQGGGETPLEISKLELGNGILNAYVTFTDASLANTIDIATNAINNALSNDLDLSTLDISDEKQALVVEEVEEKLDEVKNILTNNPSELNEEVVEELVSAINELSSDNQDLLLTQIALNANSSELEELYNELFGK